ncbi:MAG: hypothetical protein H6696_05580 [Deferribacteres bacterium]|nr:hypothetical protein [candidate division KSB1 bacterium]MCB9501389.1 hypothetical protein [Deferribacteres bacterium]
MELLQTTRPNPNGQYHLDYAQSLTHRFAMYIPSINANGLVPKHTRDVIIKQCREKVIQLCGGATEWNTWGSWMSTNNVISEDVRIIAAFYADPTGTILDELLQIAKWLKSRLKQERIAIEMNGVLYLI